MTKVKQGDLSRVLHDNKQCNLNYNTNGKYMYISMHMTCFKGKELHKHRHNRETSLLVRRPFVMTQKGVGHGEWTSDS